MELAMAASDEAALRSAMNDVASYLIFCTLELQGVMPGGMLTPVELDSLRQNGGSVCEHRSVSERARFDAMRFGMKRQSAAPVRYEESRKRAPRTSCEASATARFASGHQLAAPARRPLPLIILCMCALLRMHGRGSHLSLIHI